MKAKLYIPLILTAMLPVLLTGFLGFRLVQDQHRRQEDQFIEYAQARLINADQLVLAHLHNMENQFQLDSNELQNNRLTVNNAIWHSPLLSQIWQIEDDKIVSPITSTPSLMIERLIQQTHIVKEEGTQSTSKKLGESFLSSSRQRNYSSARNVPEFSFGWFVWFAESQLKLIFWQKMDAQRIFAFELITPRLLSDIIGQLPLESSTEYQIRLIDSNQKILYSWGEYEPTADQKPLTSRALTQPLGSWHLDYFAPAVATNTLIGYLSLLAALLAISTLMFGGAWFFYRKHTREIHQAQQRVNFVNQVSHELKTPLTSIRMYAELLQDSLPEEESENHHFLKIISQESERLSRLIANVLTFGKFARGTTKLHRVPSVVDDVVRTVIEACAANFHAHHICVDFEANASKSVLLDPDLLEQILHNLFSNVLKYAPTSGRIIIRSSQTPGVTSLVVRDYGPGISNSLAKKIFQPFFRIHSTLTEGVSGTGIGLSIARDLARLHGGDLTLIPCETGACFECRLRTPNAHQPETCS